MSWWITQPVYPSIYTKHWDTIKEIPKFIPDLKYRIYTFDLQYLDELLDFINNNYITGYRITRDYLYRKISFIGATSLVLMENNIIIGFIYSSPIKINNINCSYVDLMTVASNKRKSGLAKILISAITNYSNSQHYIHKKDKTPLPFPFFYNTKHYSANVHLNYKQHKFDLIETNYNNINYVYSIFNKWKQAQQFQPIVHSNTFMSSESIKTYYIHDFIVSISIFEFTYGFIRNTKIAEVFFINYNVFSYDHYQSLLHKLKMLDIHFLVVQDNLFFRDIIKNDNFLESMDLYLHSFNLFIPNSYNNIQLPVF
jgi:hypothetical protein